jgi:hypothetical protein
LKAIGFIIPLMDPEYASYYTKEVTVTSGKRVFAILAFIAISAIMTVMTVMII